MTAHPRLSWLLIATVGAASGCTRGCGCDSHPSATQGRPAQIRTPPVVVQRLDAGADVATPVSALPDVAPSTPPPPLTTPHLASPVDVGRPMEPGEEVARVMAPIADALKHCYDGPNGAGVPNADRSAWIMVDPYGHVVDAGVGGDASVAVRGCVTTRVHGLHFSPRPGPARWFGYPLGGPPASAH